MRLRLRSIPRHLRTLIYLGLRYVYLDLEDMRTSGYDVETIPQMKDRREQRALGEWLLKLSGGSES